jgi:hypothetical protein
MTKLFCGCVLSLLLSVTSASAGRSYIGVGTASCGKWVEARKQPGSPLVLQLRGWLFGFMSGTNSAMQAEGALTANPFIVWGARRVWMLWLFWLGRAKGAIPFSRYQRLR